MTLAGFSAETSLYETRLHYRSTGASVQANGVMLQQLHGQLHGPPGTCGPCVYDDERGYCVRQCTAFGYPYIATCNCPGGGGGSTPVAVDPEAVRARCRAERGFGSSQPRLSNAETRIARE